MRKFPNDYREEFKRFIQFYQNKEWDEASKQAQFLKDLIKE